MNMKSGRAYEQTLRAQKVHETEARLLEVAERLFARERFDRVTLDAVAREAGVTVPTVQRRFGNKEGLFLACAEVARARIAAQRPTDVACSRREAMGRLIDHYEAEGAMVWHLLRQEDDVPALREGLADGRRYHRAWVEAVFGGSDDVARIDALVAATDLFVWKLLRLDLGRTRTQVEHTMNAMVDAIVGGR
jgi:AcrR family transcriptional regulator